jgi:hypothetical protein
MEISKAAHAEIAAKLKEVGSTDNLLDEDEMIVLPGIALIPEETAYKCECTSHAPNLAEVSDEDLLAELHNRKHRFSPDEYMSPLQSDDRAKLGILRGAIINMRTNLIHATGECPAWLQTLASKSDELDSVHGNPVPERAHAINTTFVGKDDIYQDHSPK